MTLIQIREVAKKVTINSPVARHALPGREEQDVHI